MKPDETRRIRGSAPKVALALASLLVSFGLIEIGYRSLDPFPYISPREVNSTEHGNLSEYDPILGWKGVAGGAAELVTPHSRTWLAHNRLGFRDLEHDDDVARPAVVFLGDSFTWGYEVEFDDMFVNRLRASLRGYELYNLAHRGYGTDQQLLTFRQWRGDRRLRLVVLMFSENDVDDNNASVRSRKPKPSFELVDEKLVLTGTPVARVEQWVQPNLSGQHFESWRETLERRLFQSHALHDMWFRYQTHRASRRQRPKHPGERADLEASPLELTTEILRVLREEVEASGAELLIFFVPSRREFTRAGSSRPYQREIAATCEQLGIPAIDLAPAFRETWYRTYYRGGGHWTPRGHEVAADAMREPLARVLAR